MGRTIPATIPGGTVNATTDAPTTDVAEELRRHLYAGLFTREQAAHALGLSRFQVDKLIKSGELSVSRIGKTPYVGQATLETYIAKLRGEVASANGSAPTE
jgi:excisionase family DNA binding protein